MPLRKVDSRNFSRAFKSLIDKYERECKVKVAEMIVDRDVRFYAHFERFRKRYKFDLRQSRNYYHNSVSSKTYHQVCAASLRSKKLITFFSRSTLKGSGRK